MSIKKHRNDYYYKKAKADKYKSRAAYKLLEINKNFKILKNAKVIIDLCCAPGSWLQVLKRKLTEQENISIIAVDLVNIDVSEDYIKFIKGDITQDTIISELNNELPRPADLVISDCSPKLIGAKDTDHARQIYLAECSLNIAKNCLRIGGNFLTKVFQGDMLDQFKEKVMKIFHSCRIYKPKASPRKSREEYLLAFGLKAKKIKN
ncbi:MAG: RlmE family RNA methyltransferase [Candidatus Helarchaeota archaeon]|nr:RlmE family RNA methyltransferase [Candidatus Helarchaeota archaeon]